MTDRQVNNFLNAARIASNTDVAAAQTVANQIDQRHIMIPIQVVTTSLTAAATYRYVGFVADRAYNLISARIIPAAAITAVGTSFLTWNIVWNNDAGGADTTAATLSVNTTSLVANQSFPLVVTAANAAIASGKQVDVLIGFAGAGAVVPAGTANAPYVIDMVVQEV